MQGHSTAPVLIEKVRAYMASEYTPNYNLDKYVGTDKPNLRDQYNTAMDKIDAQFLNVANDHTQTGNQISAINTNIAQLGERVTTANGNITKLGERVTTAEGNITQLGERIDQANTQLGERIDQANTRLGELDGRVTTAEGAIEQANAKLAEVKTTADSAASLSSTNKDNIANLGTSMKKLNQEVETLQGAARSQVLYDASSADFFDPAVGVPTLLNNGSLWDEHEVVARLDPAIPTWANWLDIYIGITDDYATTGSTSFTNTKKFLSDVSVKSFPLNEYYRDSQAGPMKTRRADKFSFSTVRAYTAQSGMIKIETAYYPFIINGDILTQHNMGIAHGDGDSNVAFTNEPMAYDVFFAPNTGDVTLQSTSARQINIYKIVARA